MRFKLLSCLLNFFWRTYTSNATNWIVINFLGIQAKLKEVPSLEGHVILKKLRDALEFLKGRMAGRNKDDVEKAISMVCFKFAFSFSVGCFSSSWTSISLTLTISSVVGVMILSLGEIFVICWHYYVKFVYFFSFFFLFVFGALFTSGEFVNHFDEDQTCESCRKCLILAISLTHYNLLITLISRSSSLSFSPLQFLPFCN